MTSFFICKHIWKKRIILLCFVLIFGATWVWADQPQRVGLVIMHDNDQVIKKCVEFSGEEISGYELLEKTGLDLNIDVSGLGAAVCRIDHEGCNYPADQCFCQCLGETCKFWSYWYLNGNTWKFSGFGASNRTAHAGDVEGWVWGEGSPSRGGKTPPDVTFAEICGVSPTATHTPRPTDTPTPTDTPAPTNSPVPTPTATPKPTKTVENIAAPLEEIAEAKPTATPTLTSTPIPPQTLTSIPTSIPTSTATHRPPSATPNTEIATTTPSPTVTATSTLALRVSFTPTPSTTSITTPTSTPTATLQPTPQTVSVLPTIAPLPRKPQPAAVSNETTWSSWAKLGLWGGLLGGWCILALCAMIGWGIVWWVRRR